MKKNLYLALTLLPGMLSSMSLEAKTALRAKTYDDVVESYGDDEDDGYMIAESDDDDDDNFVSASEETDTPVNTNKEIQSTTDHKYPGMNRPNMVYSGQPFPTDSCNLSLFADFLYVSANANDLVYASFEETSGLKKTYDYKTFDRSYSPAFRLGADFSFSAQGWTFGTDWTRVDQHNTQTKHFPYSEGDAIVIYTPEEADAFGSNEEGGSVYGKQSLFFNEVNITVGKEIFFSKYFSFRPTGTGSFLWFTHDFHNNYSNIDGFSYNDIKFKNEFFGFGFKFGGSSRFQLGHGFYILGDAQLGIICGPRDVYQDSIDDDLNQNKSHLHSSIFLPLLDGRMDLGYRRSLSHDRFGLDIYVGYEYHNYFNAVQILQRGEYDSVANVVNQINHDLGIQGMNAGLRLSF